MRSLLYLDSARMGLMSERARLAHLDYLRLAAEQGCSLYFDQLLHEGFAAWPPALRQCYPHLADWSGIEGLKSALRRVVDQPASTPVLLANRTTQLVAMAARQLVERCRRILVTDLTWPTYQRLFQRPRTDGFVGLTTVPLRQAALQGLFSKRQLLSRIVSAYDRNNCDGLFLPAVSHDGVRLPVDRICQAASQIRPAQFAVVDGAQAFCHLPDELGLAGCDIFIAGCHKWLGGHMPMGIAYLPKGRSAQNILESVDRGLLGSQLDDPLLTFTRQVESESLEPFSETVNLASLFSCRAALADTGPTSQQIARQFAQRIANAGLVRRLAARLGWTALGPPYQTGIILLQADRLPLRRIPPAVLRRFFFHHGISVTCYEQGLLRLAMPARPFDEVDLQLLTNALWQLDQECPTIDKDFQQPLQVTLRDDAESLHG